MIIIIITAVIIILKNTCVCVLIRLKYLIIGHLSKSVSFFLKNCINNDNNDDDEENKNNNNNF